jgi:hypothetical protein
MQRPIGRGVFRKIDELVLNSCIAKDVAQHGNVRLSDAAEERILDDVRSAAAELLDAPLRSIALVGGASEALGQLA